MNYALGKFALMTTMVFSATVAADDQDYDYRVDVYNGVDATVNVSCNREHNHELHMGDSTAVKLHGGEYLRIECVAFDHHGNQIGERRFDLDHDHPRTQWTVGSDHSH